VFLPRFDVGGWGRRRRAIGLDSATLVSATLSAFLLLAAPSARAFDVPDEFASFQGFATLGLARGSSAEVGVVSNLAQKNPVFDQWSPNLDSLIGGQATFRFSASDALIAQAVARAGDDWAPRLTLGFWRHQFEDGPTVRVGRITSPLFRDSDVINVGYANLAVRPPLPIYMKVNAMPSFDGIDATWRWTLPSAELGLQAYYGGIGYENRVHPDDARDIKIRGRQMRGLALSLRNGDFSARLAHTVIPHFSFQSPDLDALNAGLTQMSGTLRSAFFRSAQADALGDFFDPLDARSVYTSLGFEWSPDAWRVIGEWTHFESRSKITPSGAAWQLTVGRSFGRWTPYVTASHQSSRPQPMDATAFAPTGSAAFDAGLTAMQGQIAYLRQTADVTMRSEGLGVRIDVADNLALKLQYERLHARYSAAVAPGLAGRVDPPAGNLFSVVLDMTF